MRAVVLYNPAAGTDREKRQEHLATAAQALRRAGFEIELLQTAARGTAGTQAREAVDRGAEAIFACGGDGTIHDVLQGVAGTDALLGVLPAGSANALARALGLNAMMSKAAAAFRPDRWMEVPVSVVRRRGEPDRYFLSMAGAGPDGALTYHMLTTDRSRQGRWAYPLHALRLFLRHSFPPFGVKARGPDGKWRQHVCVSAMAVRIGSLGGVFRGLARGAGLRRPTLRLLLVHPPAWRNLPLWFAASWLGFARRCPGLTIVDTDTLRIEPMQDAPPLQADGEWLGRTPATIEMTEQTVCLLMPAEGGERRRRSPGIPSHDGANPQPACLSLQHAIRPAATSAHPPVPRSSQSWRSGTVQY